LRAPRGHAPNIPVRWIEETVCADVRQFLNNPGEVIERIRAQMESNEETAALEERHTNLATRLTAKHKERERWLHLYAQGHILEDELELHLADLRTQLDNLKMLLSSVESDLASRREEARLVQNAEAWLLTLRERMAEVEEDTDEAFEKRRQLVKLLVAGITAGRDEDGRLDVRITYRFGPPAPAPEVDVLVYGVENSPAQLALKHSSKRSGAISRIPPISKAPAL
jgi:hypothetical protein